MMKSLKNDVGLGMVEMAVAIIVLGVILVGFLPMLYSTLGLATGNQSIAFANQTVVDEIENRKQALRETPCESSPAVATYTVQMGTVEELAVTSRITCVIPGYTYVTVEVSDSSGKVLSSGKEEVYHA